MLETEPLVRFSIFLFLSFLNVTWAQTHKNNKIDSLLVTGIDHIISQDYEDAFNTFNYLDHHYNEVPLGNIYIAATEIAKAVDYEEELNEEFVDSILVLARAKTDSLLDIDDENIWYNYYDALIYGYKAYYNSLSGNIVSAFADGVLSLRAFQNCLELDNEFNEAYIALGSYNYWKSAQTKSLLWLPFVQDKREDGINLLEKALEAASYNKYLAAYSLAWIYIDYNQSAKAVELSLQMLKEYPESRYFRWCLARAYQDIDKENSIIIFKEILNSIEKLENRNQFNDIVLRHKIAMLYYELEKFDDALNLCDEILAFNIKSIKIKERLEDRLIRTNELKEILIEKLKETN